MKRLLLTLWMILLCANVNAQQPYRELATFSGDTVSYLRYNFEQNKQRYVGQRLEKLLGDYEAGHGFTNTKPEDGNVIEGTKISPWSWADIERGIWLEITFREPLTMDMNPRIQRITWGCHWMEMDYWLVAMKMKDAIVGDIKLMIVQPELIPPRGINEKILELYKQVLSDNERRNAKYDDLNIELTIDPKTGKISGTNIKFSEHYKADNRFAGFKAVPPEKWISLDNLIKNAGFVFRVKEGVDKVSYKWYYEETEDVLSKRYAALRGTPLGANQPGASFSVNTQKPASPLYIYNNSSSYREYTIRSVARGVEIKFIYCTYNLPELAKVRNVMGQDTETRYSNQFTTEIGKQPMWAIAEFYDVNDFIESIRSYEHALEMVEYFKTKTFYIIDDRPNMPITGNQFPYSFGIRDFQVKRIP